MVSEVVKDARKNAFECMRRTEGNPNEPGTIRYLKGKLLDAMAKLPGNSHAESMWDRHNTVSGYAYVLALENRMRRYYLETIENGYEITVCLAAAKMKKLQEEVSGITPEKVISEKKPENSLIEFLLRNLKFGRFAKEAERLNIFLAEFLPEQSIPVVEKERDFHYQVVLKPSYEVIGNIRQRFVLLNKKDDRKVSIRTKGWQIIEIMMPSIDGQTLLENPYPMVSVFYEDQSKQLLAGFLDFEIALHHRHLRLVEGGPNTHMRRVLQQSGIDTSQYPKNEFPISYLDNAQVYVFTANFGSQGGASLLTPVNLEYHVSQVNKTVVLKYVFFPHSGKLLYG